MPRHVYWVGDSPTHCDLFEAKTITDEFIDGKTQIGPWACMHPDTHKEYGVGLGLGLGQRYRKQPDGRWLKVEG